MAEAAQTKKKGIVRKGFKLTAIFIALVIIFLVAGFILTQLFPRDDIHNIRNAVNSIAPVLTAIRVSIMINIIIFWERVCNFAAARYKWSPERLAGTLGHRKHYALMFAVLEFCINYRLIENLFR